VGRRPVQHRGWSGRHQSNGHSQAGWPNRAPGPGRACGTYPGGKPRLD